MESCSVEWAFFFWGGGGRDCAWLFMDLMVYLSERGFAQDNIDACMYLHKTQKHMSRSTFTILNKKVKSLWQHYLFC